MSDEKTKDTIEGADEVKVETTPTPATEPALEENTDVKEAESAAIPEVEENVEVVVLPNADIKPGMLVRVHERIKDTNSKGEDRERVQVFEGLVMGVRGAGPSRTTTIRKDSKGWMVEKIYPLSSPNIEKIEVVKTYRVRRAKLAYLRGAFNRKLKEIKETK